MTRGLTPGLEAHRNELRDLDPWKWLVEFQVPTDPPTRYRLVDNVLPVNFGVTSAGVPLTFSPAPIRVAAVRSNAGGDLPQIEITVANVDMQVGLEVEQYDGLIGQPVKLMLVNLADISNPQSRIEESGEIQGATVTADAVTFLVSSQNLARWKFPKFRVSSRSCRHAYGGVDCGYVLVTSPGETVGTGFSTCRKSLEQCEERGDDEDARGVTRAHPKRFGGFPGVPRIGRGF